MCRGGYTSPNERARSGEWAEPLIEAKGRTKDTDLRAWCKGDWAALGKFELEAYRVPIDCGWYVRCRVCYDMEVWMEEENAVSGVRSLNPEQAYFFGLCDDF